MTNEEAIEVLSQDIPCEHDTDLIGAMKMGIEALEQSNSDEDCISRKEVIKAIDKHTFETDDGVCLDDDITCILEDIPSIQPKKVGHWISRKLGKEIFFDCSECNKLNYKSSKFCPNCGAKMEGATE